MGRRLRLLPGAAAALLIGCAHHPRGAVNVVLSAGAGSSEEVRLLAAVQGAVQTNGLSCLPSTGAVLLRCSPAALGNQGDTVTVVVSRMAGGYQVSIDQALSMLGRAAAVCDVQRAVTDAINAQVAPGAARAGATDACQGAGR